jgi:hypothetical protein
MNVNMMPQVPMMGAFPPMGMAAAPQMANYGMPLGMGMSIPAAAPSPAASVPPTMPFVNLGQPMMPPQQQHPATSMPGMPAMSKAVLFCNVPLALY